MISWLLIFLFSLANTKISCPNCSTHSIGFKPGVSRQLTTGFNSQLSPRLGDCHRAQGGIILLSLAYSCGSSLGWKCICEYLFLFNQVSSRNCRWSNVKKSKLLEDIIEEYKRRWLIWFIYYFKSLLIWIAYLLNFLVDSMASQNPEDWDFSLAHLSDDSIWLSQPSTFKQRMRDEVKTFEGCIQLRSDLDPQ